jgi:DNA-binding winged helix-turn-helix (wHTH) protein
MTDIIAQLSWPPAPVPVQFHFEPRLDVRHALHGSATHTPVFDNRVKPPATGPTEFSFGPFRLLTTQFLLLKDNQPVPLGGRALEILIALLERRGELVSKQQLMARVWPNVFVEPANLTVHISALRRMLRDGRDVNRFIINIPGRGYSFVGPVAVSHAVRPNEDDDPVTFHGSPRAQFVDSGHASGERC